MTLAFYSTPSGNTRRFVERVGAPALEIGKDETATEPYLLVTPTYNGRVPAPVVRFLNDPANRALLRGVVGSGSTNFGADFARAGRTVSQRCGVPLLHVFELSGLPEDVTTVQDHLETQH